MNYSSTLIAIALLCATFNSRAETPAPPPATVPDALRGDGIQLDTTTGTSASITVSGLVPGNRYDLVLFGSEPANPANATFNGATRVTDGVFKEVPSDANGNIRGSVVRTDKMARLAGLQIQGIFKK